MPQKRKAPTAASEEDIVPAADAIKGTPPAKKPKMESILAVAAAHCETPPRRPRRNLVRDFYNGSSGTAARPL